MPRTWEASSTADQLAIRQLVPPAGWRWSYAPEVAPGSSSWTPGQLVYEGSSDGVTDDGYFLAANYFETYPELRAWAEENRFEVAAWTEGHVRAPEGNPNLDYIYVWTGFQVTPKSRVRTNEPLIPPVVDGVEQPWVENGRLVMCNWCGTPYRHRAALVRLDGDIVCTAHRRQCRADVQDITPITATSSSAPASITSTVHQCTNYCSRRFLFCAEHDTRVECRGCDRQFSIRGNTSIDDVCPDCEEFRCEGCDAVGTNSVRYNRPLRAYLCDPCLTDWQSRPDPNSEEFDADVDSVTPAELKIESHPQRPVRYCSIEMELAEGGREVLAVLERERLAFQGGRLASYHHGNTGNAFCYMETDSSLGSSGGELIIPFLKLDNDEVLSKLHTTIRTVRDTVRNGQATMDVRCGLHIHVDAHRMGIGHVRNLAVLFNFLEDPLYRMSAARYMRHRGMHYANKIDKEGIDTVRAFGVNFLSRNGHAHALNVGHYWEAIRSACSCGAAIIGQHQDCDCNLGKCTFEFRIYNGTTNFRKIHAYAALSQSLVAYARGNDGDLSLNDFPVFEYVQNAAVNSTHKAKWEERIEWMFRNLYFSEFERQSVLYVLKNCQLRDLGEERLEQLAALPFSGNVTPHEAPDNADRSRNTAGGMPRFVSDNIVMPDPDHCGSCGNHLDYCDCAYDDPF